VRLSCNKIKLEFIVFILGVIVPDHRRAGDQVGDFSPVNIEDLDYRPLTDEDWTASSPEQAILLDHLSQIYNYRYIIYL